MFRESVVIVTKIDVSFSTEIIVLTSFEHKIAVLRCVRSVKLGCEPHLGTSLKIGVSGAKFNTKRRNLSYDRRKSVPGFETEHRSKRIPSLTLFLSNTV